MGDHVILEWLNGSLVFFLFVLRNVERKAERAVFTSSPLFVSNVL